MIVFETRWHYDSCYLVDKDSEKLNIFFDNMHL